MKHKKILLEIIESKAGEIFGEFETMENECDYPDTDLIKSVDEYHTNLMEIILEIIEKCDIEINMWTYLQEQIDKTVGKFGKAYWKKIQDKIK